MRWPISSGSIPFSTASSCSPMRRSRSATWWRSLYLDADVETVCRDALAVAGFAQTELELTLAELAAPAGAVRASAELGVAVPNVVVPELDPVTRGLLQYSALQPARRLVRADRVRARLRRGLADALAECDLLAWPTSPAPAPPIDAPVLQLPSGPALPDAPNVRQAILANLAGVPAVSVPAGFHSSGLPIGLQLLAPWREESRLLDAAQRIEDATDQRWVKAAPTLAYAARWRPRRATNRCGSRASSPSPSMDSNCSRVANSGADGCFSQDRRRTERPYPPRAVLGHLR